MARVVDLTKLSAAYATRLLVEAGHEVIRIEPPQGDDVRRMGPFLGDKVDAEHSAYHFFLNAGKRSLTLDLTFASGQEILFELLATADVLVANVPLPFEESLVTDRFPNLVFTRVHGDSPEICSYARSGLLAITGHPGESPVLMGGHVVYAATGLHVAVATAAAMYVQKLTGQGQAVDVSVDDCMEGLVEQAMVTYTSTGKVPERRGYRGAVTAVSGAFPTTDGFWMLSVPHTSQGWASFMEWVQDPVLAADASLSDEAERNAKKDFILGRLDVWSSQFEKDGLVEEAQRRHIPAAPVTTPFDLSHDPQLIDRGFLREIDHPEFGKMLFPAGAIASLRGSDVSLAPTLGQHNAEILAELGYSPADQRALVENGAM